MFLQEPGAGVVHQAPLGQLLQLRCSVSAQHHISAWYVLFHGETQTLTTDVPTLRSTLQERGITERRSNRNSILVINSTVVNNTIYVSCLAEELTTLRRTLSRIVQVIFYGTSNINSQWLIDQVKNFRDRARGSTDGYSMSLA